MKNQIADIHVHSGMKGYANCDCPEYENMTIWDHFPEKKKELKKLNVFVRMLLKELSKESQVNLDSCMEGHVTATFIAICPPERPMFTLSPGKPFRWLFKLLLPKRKYEPLAVAVTGFPREKVASIFERVRKNKGVDYYQEEYLHEKEYLIQQTQKESKKYPGCRFGLARNYGEFERMIEAGDAVVGILTVEGAHSFGHYMKNTTFNKAYEELEEEEKKVLWDSFTTNVKEVKNSDYPPFFVTFSHHFNNLLAGHSRSLSAKSRMISSAPWPYLPGFRHVFNQEPNLDQGFTPLGREVLRLLLDKEEGKRILIDTKHMSVKSRQEFYEYIYNKQTRENDSIPIIHSHAAVSGWRTLEEAGRQKEDKELDRKTYFSRARINLTDEDILHIYDSDGLIGLILNEDRMPGGQFRKRVKKLKKDIEYFGSRKDKKSRAEKEKCECELCEETLRLLWSNAFHIAKVVRDGRGEDGWKIVALGSDYDGLVNPFNSWPEGKHFNSLKQKMLEYLECGKEIFWAHEGKAILLPQAEIKALMAGRTPEELVDDIFFDNVDRFLAKYFV